MEKAKLFNNILCILYEKQINVVSITFDEILDAQLNQTTVEQILPYFIHPVDESKRIYIFYACHMLKLVRNPIGK